MKKHIKKGKNVSMGFGFVEFDSVETATSVCKDLQVSPLDLPVRSALPSRNCFPVYVIMCPYVFSMLNDLPVNRGQFWMGMLLSCNCAMGERMVRLQRKMKRIRVQPSCLCEM